MNKYAPLFQLLRNSKADFERMSFEGLESRTGPLPPSARKRRQWWANQRSWANRPQCSAWSEAGFKVEQVDTVKKIVEFRRVKSTER
jgi:hypothetical protein